MKGQRKAIGVYVNLQKTYPEENKYENMEYNIRQFSTSIKNRHSNQVQSIPTYFTKEVNEGISSPN